MKLQQHTYTYSSAEPPGITHPPQIRIVVSINHNHPQLQYHQNVTNDISTEKESKHSPLANITRVPTSRDVGPKIKYCTENEMQSID